MQITRKIREFVKKNLVVFEDYVFLKDEDNIFEQGFVDSLFALQLVSFIESEFKIELNNEDLDITNFNSIQNLTALVESKKNI
ncbi:acyl carrier protein [Acidobacteriota bacterium]